MMTILFSGVAGYQHNDFEVAKGDAEIDIFTLSGRNVGGKITMMLFKGNVICKTKQ